MKFRDSYFFFLKQDPFFLKYLVGFRGTETISDGWYSGVWQKNLACVPNSSLTFLNHQKTNWKVEIARSGQVSAYLNIS